MVRFLRLQWSPHYKADSTSSRKIEEGKFRIYPTELDITWGRDSRYWNLSTPNKSREGSIAELKQVCWLEVSGSTNENVKVGKTYRVGFRVSLRPDAFGWDECNVYIMAKIGKRGNFSFKQVSLSEETSRGDQQFNIPKHEDLEIKVDQSIISTNNSDLNLYFGMYEVWSKKWKGGLNIHYAFVEEC